MPSLKNANTKNNTYVAINADYSILARVVYTAENYASMLDSCGKPPVTRACHLDSEELQSIFYDFCWALKQNVLPISQNEPKQTWLNVISTFGKHSEMVINGLYWLPVAEWCACCVKGKEAYQCLHSWNKICRHTKLMKYLNLN